MIKEAVLYSFGVSNADGVLSLAGLIIDNQGNLFGTTYQGGRDDEGTVFEISQASGKETVLYSFGTNGSDGRHPYAGLIYRSQPVEAGEWSG